MEQNWAAVLVVLQIPTDFLFLLPKGFFLLLSLLYSKDCIHLYSLNTWKNRSFFLNMLVQSVFKLETSMRPGKIGGCSVIILNFFQFR